MDWKPIETAPKDGTDILLFTDAEQCIEGTWSADNEYWASVIYNSKNEPLLAHDGKPTHWMPLPEPPKEGIV